MFIPLLFGHDGISIVITACSELQKAVFGAVSLWFFVYEISLEPLNGFAPSSHRRHVLSLARTSLKAKVKDQGHQGQKRHFLAFSAACMWFMFDKTYYDI